jgi:hypothetical protein
MKPDALMSLALNKYATLKQQGKIEGPDSNWWETGSPLGSV